MLLSIHLLIENLAERVAQWIVTLFERVRQPFQPSQESKPDSSSSSDNSQNTASETSDQVQQPIDFAAEQTAEGIFRVGQVLWEGLKSIPRRLARYFQFLLHLNWNTVKTIGIRTVEQRLGGFSAEMAFQSMLALFPALLAILAAISLSESLQSILYDIASLLAEIAPEQVRQLIARQLIINRSPQLFSFSFVLAIWLFSSVISSAMAALNHIHHVPRDRLRPFWRAKLIAVGLAVGSLMLLILASGLVFVSDLVVETLARKSCILETVGTCPIDQINLCLEQPPVQSCLLEQTLSSNWLKLRWPITLGVVSINFALIYRYGPSQRQPETPIMPGAILSAILWAFLSNLFRLYVYHFGNYNFTYGTIGAFIILLLWLYICCLVMLIGAQLNVTVGEAIALRARRRQ
ncbi:MAG: YihY/virulence factor BrkB family protein [Microcoleaceae cyanobacterium]